MYISGFVTPVPTANKDAYREMSSKAAALFKDYGAIEMVEAWGDEVPDGKVTDFRRAVAAKQDEAIVFSWIIWPDKATSDAAEAKMQDDERMSSFNMPFDGKRMIYGGFDPIFVMGR